MICVIIPNFQLLKCIALQIRIHPIMFSRISIVLQIALLFVICSCNVFELQEEETVVSGSYFDGEAARNLHFSDSCFFSEFFPDILRSYTSGEELVELSCLISASERRESGDDCIFLGIPKDACKIENNRLTFSARCSVHILFISIISRDFIYIFSHQTAKAHFRGSAHLTEDVSPGPVRVDLKLDNGDRIKLLFNHVISGNVFYTRRR